MTAILGISAFYHDSAAALIVDGNLVAAAQEERFSRIRHDEGFPVQAVEFCLKRAGLKPENLDYVAFYDKPVQKFDRLLETYISYAPSGLSSFLKAMPVWLKDKLWTQDSLYKHLTGFEGPVFFPEHHESHAASAFFPSPFRSAAFLTMDGVGEWTTTSWGTGRENTLSMLKEIRFPHSAGLLYSAFTFYTGFKVNSGEYKVMGLAPYGRPVYVQKILDHLIDIREDGSFRLNMDYFEYPYGLKMTSKAFEDLFGGPARKPETPLTQREMDLACSIQKVTEDLVLKIAGHIRRETGEENLCLAGGVALNCVANGILKKTGLYRNIWVQPAAGDAGGAAGAAWYVWHKALGNSRNPDGNRDSQSGSYLGPEYPNEEIRHFLVEKGIKYHEYRGKLPSTIAALIEKQKVIGLFRGRMEYGPRALGSRSIIGDARSPGMQSVMNLKIKFRESFRPFAPAIKSEKVSDWFEFEGESPYMLMVAGVREEKRRYPENRDLFGIELLNQVRSEIPAVTHVDFSARIQTVHRETNLFFWQILDEFEKLTGVPIVINTSFNVRGEPIVCRPEEAFTCFMNTGMDVLVLGDFVLYKTEMPESGQDSGYLKKFELD
ncbi:MAG: carbamoyltransferase [Bacteroidetes bacterium]|nr:carbamoyltransferase [Bacteroidota bacterium]